MTKHIKKFNENYYPDRCGPLIQAVDDGHLHMKALSRVDYPGQYLPDSVLPGVFSIGYWDAKKEQQWGLDWHRNEGVEFSFLESGNLPFSTENEKVNLNSGSLTITKPWQLHKVGDPKVTIGKLYWIIIDVGVKQPHQPWRWPQWVILSREDIELLTKILRESDIRVWQSEKRIRECFVKIGECLEHCELEIPHSKLAIVINNLLLEILQQFKNGNIVLDNYLTHNSKTIEVFLDHLRSNYERSWSLDDMSDYCGLGKTSLSSYCKQLTNMTPVNYLINVRLEAAAKMLIDKDIKNITDICYDCGFSKSQYFATAFKKKFNCSPSDYRLALRV